MYVFRIPHYAQRVRTLLFKKKFSVAANEAQSRAALVLRAARDMTRSRRLRALLEVVLALGNYMNRYLHSPAPLYLYTTSRACCSRWCSCMNRYPHSTPPPIPTFTRSTSHNHLYSSTFTPLHFTFTSSPLHLYYTHSLHPQSTFAPHAHIPKFTPSPSSPVLCHIKNLTYCHLIPN